MMHLQGAQRPASYLPIFPTFQKKIPIFLIFSYAGSMSEAPYLQDTAPVILLDLDSRHHLSQNFLCNP